MTTVIEFTCEYCGRVFDTEIDEVLQDDPCPSDDCPSNTETEDM